MTTVSHESWLLKFLSDPANAAGYLDAAAEDDDPKYMLEALRRVVRAQGGIGRLAKATKLSRTTLYKTLSPAGNPGVHTLDAILGVYDLRIGFHSTVGEKRGRYKARKKP